MNLATYAHQLKKEGFTHTKADTINLLEMLYSQASDDDTRLAIGRIYLNFVPKAPKAATNNFNWATKAVGAKDVREYLQYVHVEGDTVAATDGNRLHVYKNTDGLKDGFYFTHGDVQEATVGKFPQISRVIEVHTQSVANFKEVIANRTFNVSKRDKQSEVIFTTEYGVVWLTEKYFNDAVSRKNVELTDVRHNGSNEAGRLDFHFEDGSIAIIMGRRPS